MNATEIGNIFITASAHRFVSTGSSRPQPNGLRQKYSPSDPYLEGIRQSCNRLPPEHNRASITWVPFFA